MTDTPSLNPSRFPALRAAARKPQTFDNVGIGAVFEPIANLDNNKRILYCVYYILMAASY